MSNLQSFGANDGPGRMQAALDTPRHTWMNALAVSIEDSELEERDTGYFRKRRLRRSPAPPLRSDGCRSSSDAAERQAFRAALAVVAVNADLGQMPFWCRLSQRFQ